MLECHPDLQINLFFVTDPAPAELYTLSLTTLFRSPPPPPILRPLRAAVFFSRCRAFIFPWHVRASPTCLIRHVPPTSPASSMAKARLRCPEYTATSGGGPSSALATTSCRFFVSFWPRPAQAR